MRRYLIDSRDSLAPEEVNLETLLRITDWSEKEILTIVNLVVDESVTFEDHITVKRVG